MPTTLKEKTYLAYRELHHALLTSRIAFYSFCQKNATDSDTQFILRTKGACKLPGWQEYVTEFAFPLNEKTKLTVLKVKGLLAETERENQFGAPLQWLLDYINDWTILHAAWEGGANPDYNWSAGRNFPSSVEEYVESELVDLAGEPAIKHLLLYL